MSEDRRHKPDTERLERLYRQAADVEPDSRLDRTVTAKARRDAERTSRSALPNLRPWGLGLAAAASLALAVGLGLQLGFHSDRATPEMQQFRAGSSLEEAEQPASPAVDTSMKTEAAAGPSAMRKTRELDQADAAPARSRQSGGREPKDDRTMSADERRLAAPLPAGEAGQLSPEAWLERIHDMVEAGHLEAARDELRNFRTAYPSAAIPPEIRQALMTDTESP